MSAPWSTVLVLEDSVEDFDTVVEASKAIKLTNPLMWATDCGIRGGSWAVLSCEDAGIGISTADQERIFDWYARGENAQETVEGSGIGLAGIKQIIEQHGGFISVHSQEGLRSTFRVRLPTHRL